MRRLQMFLWAMALVSGIGCGARAIPVLFTDFVDAKPDILLDKLNKTFTYSHNIVNDGFDSATDTLNSATIALHLGGTSGKRKKVRVLFDGFSQGKYNSNQGNYKFEVDLALSKSDGLLKVDLTRKSGDFYFEGSTFQVSAHRVRLTS
jgi:hypothetical protein